jgi:mRNA interferase RelE/StbE
MLKNIENIEKSLRDKKRFPREVKKQLAKQLRILMENSKHPSLRHKPVEGTKDYWEFSINMNYRCAYRKDNNTAIIVAFGKHEDIF